MIYKDISKQIENLRNKLHLEIEKSGIGSAETLKISNELDNLIKKYYTQKNDNNNSDKMNNVMDSEYKITCSKMKKIIKSGKKFPNIKEWNKIAKKEGYLNNKAIEYMSGLNWKELKNKIVEEVNKEKNKK